MYYYFRKLSVQKLEICKINHENSKRLCETRMVTAHSNPARGRSRVELIPISG